MSTTGSYDMVELMHKHSLEIQELRLQVASAVAAKEATELLLKSCKANLESEQARVDRLLESAYSVPRTPSEDDL